MTLGASDLAASEAQIIARASAPSARLLMPFKAVGIDVNGGRLYLFGVYTGILFPDAPRAAPERATALGSVCQLGMIDHLPFVRAAATS